MELDKMSNESNNNKCIYNTDCTICGNQVNLTEYDIYYNLDPIIMNIKKGQFSSHNFGIDNKNNLYPISWEDSENIDIIICSHKCARKYYHNNIESKESGSNLENLFSKKIKI
jgi:hypothetical protein